MAQEIKNFWFKLVTVFMTVYFAPIGHFIMSLFGGRSDSNNAHAGTVTCQGNGTDKMDCGGRSGTFYDGQMIQCTCETDSTQIYDLKCDGGDRDDAWGQYDYHATWIRVTKCYSRNACSPNGSTRDCSTDAQYCTQTCTNGQWGTIVLGNCKPGYIKVNGRCNAECYVANGKGYEYDEPSSSSSSSS